MAYIPNHLIEKGTKRIDLSNKKVITDLNKYESNPKDREITI